MSFVGKVDFNKAYSVGKKMYNSKEGSFVRKNFNNKKMYKHVGRTLSNPKSYKDIGKALGKAKTYHTISKNIEKARKTNEKVGDTLTAISPEAGLLYPSGEIDYGLNLANRVTKKVGRTVGRVNKSKSPLEKAVRIGEGTTSLARDFI